MRAVFGLSPWLQLPLVLVVALPLAGVIGAVLLRAVDGLARLFTRGARRK